MLLIAADPGAYVWDMTLLREIQADATSNSVPVSTVLRRAQVLAFRLQHEPLKEWTRKELGGYLHDDELPPYRLVAKGQTPVKGEFVSARGILSNVTIAPSDFSQLNQEAPDIVTQLFEVRFLRPISEFEALLATGNHTFTIPWTGDEVRLAALFQPGMHKVDRVISVNAIAGMLDQVRNRVLTFSLEIERMNPDAGEAPPSEPPLEQAAVTNIFHSTIVGDGNVISAAGANSTVTQSKIDATWPALSSDLAKLGVPDCELQALSVALHQDGEQTDGIGPATKTWLGNLATKAAMGSVTLAGTDAINVVVQHLMHALGLA